MRILRSASAVISGLLACGPGASAPSAEATSSSTSSSTSSPESSSGVEAESSVTGSSTGTGELLGPPYPIVLAHGFFGFDDFAGAGFLTYFYEVRDDLEASGEPWVFTPTVDPFNDSTVRGAQLVEEIEVILRETGHAKVNIIGHSQGGLDARVVAHDRPELVASVVTVATPHWGTPIADIVLMLIEDDNAAQLIDALVQLIGAPLYDEIGEQTSVADSFHQLSQAGAAQFNIQYPNASGVPYFSVAGRSDLHLGGEDCEVAEPSPFIEDFEADVDSVDVMLALAETVLDGGLLDPDPNDGLVRVADAKWGQFLGCVPADHLDEVGQLAGDDPGLTNEWRHKPFYRAVVDYLRQRGL